MRISDWSSDVCSSDLGRTEIMVVLADKAENLIAQLRFECTVARAAALPGYKRLGTVRTQSVEQTVDLAPTDAEQHRGIFDRSEEHTSELQSLMRISYAVFCLKKKNKKYSKKTTNHKQLDHRKKKKRTDHNNN